MADESVCSLEDLKELAEGSCLQAVNCRVAKMGGLLEAARAGKAASELRLDVLVGCHVGESPVLASAGRHLAALLPEARWLEAPMERWLHRISLAASPGGFGRGGKAQIELKPGLGLQVRLDLLERIALKRLRLWPSEA
jgi:L-alanine-DL-glutamate epimerase-like enolase superfamily enzyme